MSEAQTDFKPGSPVEYTGSIPVCPFCKVLTSRTGGATYTTSMYFTPVYDEHGNNINPDRNRATKDWRCFACDRQYSTSGNQIDGFVYAYNQ